MRLNKPTDETQQQETPLHHKPLKETEKLNIILDENGKSKLYDVSVVAPSKSDNNKKDMTTSNASNKFDLSLQPLSTLTTAAGCNHPLRKDFDSFNYRDDIPSTSASASASIASSLTSPSSPSSPTSTSCNED